MEDVKVIVTEEVVKVIVDSTGSVGASASAFYSAASASSAAESAESAIDSQNSAIDASNSAIEAANIVIGAAVNAGNFTAEIKVASVIAKGPITAGTITGLPGIARFHAAEEITAHARYGYLDDSIINYSGSGFQAHASFNDNVIYNGIQNSDHAHSYQSYPHYNNTGTLGRMSGFWMLPDVAAGMITELSEHKASNPLGTGLITNLYGFYSEGLTRGTNNYAFFAAGSTPSYFGGGIKFGSGDAPYTSIAYNPNGDFEFASRAGYGLFFKTGVDSIYVGGSAVNDKSFAAKLTNKANGNFEITPRTGYDLYLNTGTNSVLIGGGDEGLSAKLTNASNGNFEITPRTGYSAVIKNILVYADNAAATAAGLAVGAIYRTATGQMMIVY